MRVYNTLTRCKEEFVTLKPGEVGFYICGPTVYNDIHIGNARTFLSFDVIRRYLRYCGYQVNYVQNVTDIDDKIINRAHEEGREAAEVADEYTQAFIDAMNSVGVEPPTVRPKATEEIQAMIEHISCLVEGGHAYVIKGDVYFSVRSFPEYGRLSGRDIDDLVAGARVSVDDRKLDPLDFALWKAAKSGEPSWHSPWGEGRPGWHIECSAMSARYLGTPFDIHAGGEDLIFPHHENELAQSEACYHDGFAKYWLHGGMLTIDKEKMSKSEGNYLLLKDVLEHVRPEALRLLMLQTHYRSPFDYSPARLDEATAALARIEGALRNIDWVLSNQEESTTTDARQHASPEARGLAKSAKIRFTESMDDDFNTAGAVAVVFDLVSEVYKLLDEKQGNSSDTTVFFVLGKTIREFLRVLGIDLRTASAQENLIGKEHEPALIALAQKLAQYKGSNAEEALQVLLNVRDQARKSKKWSTADAVRDGFSTLGLVIEDTPQGSRVIHA